MQSAFWRSCWKPVAPPRPNEVPRPGTVELCHMPRLVLDRHRARRREELLHQIVLLVVERRATQAGDAERPAQRPPLLVDVLPGLPPRLDHAVGDHVHRPVERELLPPRSVRAPVLDLVLAQRARHVVPRRGALRAQAAAGDRAVGVALDLRDRAVLDEHALPASDRAVRADRLDHALGTVRSRPQTSRAGPTARRAQARADLRATARAAATTSRGLVFIACLLFSRSGIASTASEAPSRMLPPRRQAPRQ